MNLCENDGQNKGQSGLGQASVSLKSHTKPGNQFLPLDLQAKKIVLGGPLGSWSQPGPRQRPLHLHSAFCSSPDFQGTRSATHWGSAGERDEQGTDGQMPLLDKFGPQVCP